MVLTVEVIMSIFGFLKPFKDICISNKLENKNKIFESDLEKAAKKNSTTKAGLDALSNLINGNEYSTSNIINLISNKKIVI